MYLLILFFPLLGFIICSIFGRKIGLIGSKLISCIFLFLSVLCSLFIFYEINFYQNVIYIKFFYWFNIGLLCNSFGLQFDSLTSIMLLLITLVSFFVHVYSTSYMEKDPHLSRFMSYLSLFTFFMIVLVTSNNLVQLFIGWEGVGLCSYLLINFWFTRIQANKSAIKAMVVNKVGDIALILAIFTIWGYFGYMAYDSIFSLLIFNNYSNIILNWISILILIGSIGKSAQIGLHMWLPDAMEGPTPVSALIHAATMVTAGIFIIIRMSPLFENTPGILSLIILIGSITAFFSASIGLFQFDLKKIIAYSTCSQLGYMMVICGFSYYNTGLFHLFNHGFFKALLFLSAGMIIHTINDEQDIRKMGGLKKYLPFSLICVIIGSMSLMGLPYLTGFYSKDLILELIYINHSFIYALFLTLIATLFTSFYSFRLIYYVFFKKPQNYKLNLENSYEPGYYQTLPLILLLILSLVIGYFTQFIMLKDDNPIMISNFIKWLPLKLSLLGVFLVILYTELSFNFWKFIKFNFFYIFYSFIVQIWYFDYLITIYLIKPILDLGFKITYKLIDNQLLEELGPSKALLIFKKTGQYSSNIHRGYISIYLLYFLIAIIILINRF